MEREKPLPLMAFLGCALTVVSLLVVLGTSLYLAHQTSGVYRSQPLANLAGTVLLVLGIVLMVMGFQRAK